MKTYDKNINHGVGSRLREARKSREMSLDDASDQTGFTKSRISEYENEKRAIDIYTLSTFSEAYNVTMDFLWFGNGGPYYINKNNNSILNIEEALETLNFYQILFFRCGHLIFNTGNSAFIYDFLKEYEDIFNSSSLQKNEKERVKQLEESYKDKFMAFLNPTSKCNDIIEALSFSGQNVEFKLEPSKK